jgi:hypothetical protein
MKNNPKIKLVPKTKLEKKLKYSKTQKSRKVLSRERMKGKIINSKE